MNFTDLDLIPPILRALQAAEYPNPTPIQAESIPYLLEGRDLLGCAQTGTGKTAAFAIPILQTLALSERRPGTDRRPPPIRALVLAPTRELAAQILESFQTYGQFLEIRSGLVYGGVGEEAQLRMLRRGVDILVATPGRLLDYKGRNLVDLSHVEHLVLDETDRMLDMGFIHDVKKILSALPRKRQNLLFSATMPSTVVQLAQSFLDRPARVDVAPDSPVADKVLESVMFVEQTAKRDLLAQLLRNPELERSIVFIRKKHGADRLVKHLSRHQIRSVAIHGNKSQNARLRALEEFRRGDVRVLVATDLASRGLDVEAISHVINFDLPDVPETYVHRIGRTARAGREGRAISFCDATEGECLLAIEKLVGRELPVDRDHAFHDENAVPTPAPVRGGRGREGRPSGARPHGGGRYGARPGARRVSRGGPGREGAGREPREGRSGPSREARPSSGRERDDGFEDREPRGVRDDRESHGRRERGDGRDSRGSREGSSRERQEPGPDSRHADDRRPGPRHPSPARGWAQRPARPARRAGGVPKSIP